jgi:hypothetical protein
MHNVEQRTASTIISGGNRKPANVAGDAVTGRARRMILTPPVSPPQPFRAQRNSAGGSRDTGTRAAFGGTPGPRPAARPQLDAAAPSAWAELSTADAGRLGVGGGRRRTDFVAAGVL